MYKIVILDEAEEHTEQIILHYSHSLGFPHSLSLLLDSLDGLYDNLAYFPEMYPFCKKEDHKKKGYRKAVVKNYIVTYKVNHATEEVFIHGIYHGRANYESYL